MKKHDAVADRHIGTLESKAMSIITETMKAANKDTDRGLRDVLDFLVTEEQLGVTLVTAAIERAPGTPSEAFLPVLRNAVTTEFHHVEALKAAGGKPLTTSYWFPDAAFGGGGVGLFSTLEIVESVEISLYLLGVSAYARAGDEFWRALVRRGNGNGGRASRSRAFCSRSTRQGRWGPQ